MNKMTKLTALLAVFGLVFLGSYAYAGEGEMMYQPAGWNSFEASFLIGHRVYGAGSYDQGQISDFVVDQSHGRIALVVLSDVPGFGSKEVAIPCGVLTRTAWGSFTINFPPDTEIGPLGFDTTPYAQAMAPGEIHGAIDPSWAESVYMHYGQAPYWKEAAMGWSTEFYRGSRLIGAEVQLAEGGTAGKVDDFVVDFSDGHIPLAVLSDVPGRGDTRVAVPFGSLSRRADNTFALNFTGEKLASAPGFDQFRDLNNRGYAEGVYRYFGVQPYWTEVGGMHEGGTMDYNYMDYDY